MINWERRKQSEDWSREKAKEWAEADSELTFVEWCYQQGKKDGYKEALYVYDDELATLIDDYENEQLTEQNNEKC